MSANIRYLAPLEVETTSTTRSRIRGWPNDSNHLVLIKAMLNEFYCVEFWKKLNLASITISSLTNMFHNIMAS